MIELAKWDPRILRRLNLKLLDDERYQYDLIPSNGVGDVGATRRRIANTKNRKIRRILEAAPACPVHDARGFREWWSVWMPIAVGMQIWPDGNHRTAMMVAELVAEAAGLTLVLHEPDVEQLRRESKALVMARWQRAPAVAVEEFLDSEHPLRMLYASLKGRLQLEGLPS